MGDALSFAEERSVRRARPFRCEDEPELPPALAAQPRAGRARCGLGRRWDAVTKPVEPRRGRKAINVATGDAMVFCVHEDVEESAAYRGRICQLARVIAVAPHLA